MIEKLSASHPQVKRLLRGLRVHHEMQQSLMMLSLDQWKWKIGHQHYFTHLENKDRLSDLLHLYGFLHLAI